MSKLVQAYIANPTDKNLERIRKHADKHPFACMMLSKAEALALKGKL